MHKRPVTLTAFAKPSWLRLEFSLLSSPPHAATAHGALMCMHACSARMDARRQLAKENLCRDELTRGQCASGRKGVCRNNAAQQYGCQRQHAPGEAHARNLHHHRSPHAIRQSRRRLSDRPPPPCAADASRTRASEGGAGVARNAAGTRPSGARPGCATGQIPRRTPRAAPLAPLAAPPPFSAYRATSTSRRSDRPPVWEN
jgi:hypothetical protein